MKRNSQAGRLYDALAGGMVVTRLSALTDLGIFELSARIKDIEKDGHTVNRKTIKVTNRWGEETRVKEYWIDFNKCLMEK